MAEGIPARLNGTPPRTFGLTVGPAFLVLAAVAAWRGRYATAGVFWAFAIILMGAALLAPAALVPVQRWWMRGAEILSRITTPIGLAVVYFVAILPVGVMRRMFTPSLASPRRHGGWVARPADARRRTDFDRQF